MRPAPVPPPFGRSLLTADSGGAASLDKWLESLDPNAKEPSFAANRAQGEEMSRDDPPDERVIYRDRFRACTLIFEAKAFSPL
jgi:hypothetical protein